MGFPQWVCEPGERKIYVGAGPHSVDTGFSDVVDQRCNVGVRITIKDANTKEGYWIGKTDLATRTNGVVVIKAPTIIDNAPGWDSITIAASIVDGQIRLNFALPVGNPGVEISYAFYGLQT